jgi:hypothetical protein
MAFMKLITVLRETRNEQRFSPEMGLLHTKVTYIRKAFAGIPITTIHSYRETYYGEVKACRDCQLSR